MQIVNNNSAFLLAQEEMWEHGLSRARSDLQEGRFSCII